MTRLTLWLRSVLLRRRLERDMREEMGDHLERASARLMERGLSASDARRAAIREFGNVAYLQEEGRLARGTGWLEALGADLRFALRQSARKPATTLTILAVLAVGMSISTTLFSVLHAYTMQAPPGITRADDLVRIRGARVTSGDQAGRKFARTEMEAYSGLTDHFAAVAAWTDDAVRIEAPDGERRTLAAAASFVTDDYFEVLGVRPLMGPGLSRDASARSAVQPVAILAYNAWEQLFGGRPDAVGATLIMNGVPVTIVGVAPPRFLGVNVLTERKLWLPLASRPLFVRDARPDAQIFGAAARLRPGVSREVATAAARVVATRAAESVEQADDQPALPPPTAEVVPLLSASGDPSFERESRLLTVGLSGLGLLVLLVTCMNVSALLAGLAVARRREIAIRLSLGAARIRIIRQLLTESVLLATVAGSLALGIVWVIQRMTTALIPAMPLEIGVSVPATVFTLGVALAVGVLFGLSPALHATRLTVASALRDSASMIAGSRARLQRGLVVAQIAFTQPLIVGVATMLLVLLGEYRRQGLNESGDRVVTLRLTPVAAGPVAETDTAAQRQRAEAVRQLRDQLAGTPGIVSAIHDPRLTSGLDGYTVHPDDRIQGGSEAPVRLSARMVAPGYFDVMGVPLVLGRAFTEHDSSGLRHPAGGDTPIVIGSDLARELWPNANPVGRRLRPPPDGPRGAESFTVIGVANRTLGEYAPAGDGFRVYVPPGAAQAGSLALLVRTSATAEGVLPTIREVVQERSSRLTILSMRTIAEVEAEVRNGFYLITGILAGGGALALLISAVGLYAVVAFSVQQRTGEIAVRMAVGARARNIVSQFIGDGLRLSVVGLALGLPLSLIALHLLLSVAEILPPVSLTPVGVIAGFSVLAVAAAAAWIPARRAAGVDPALVLRKD